MTLFWAGVVVAVAAAARSTWSPCGLSMLSSITPFGEWARGHRYSITAGWFGLGAAVGGACLGAGAAAVAAILGAVGAGGAGGAVGGGGAVGASSAGGGALGAASAGGGVASVGGGVLAVAAGLCLLGALVDAGRFGPVLPVVRRQVNDAWLARYRPWVYGAGFGWQVGVGLATYVMTAGVGVLVGLGGLTGSPVEAVTLGLIFGAVRGSTVFLTAGAADPARLRALHRWLDRLGPAVRGGVAGVMGGAAVGLAGAALWGPARHGWLGGVAALAPPFVGAGLGAWRAGAGRLGLTDGTDRTAPAEPSSTAGV
jgi:hypothetical protein